jgi:hypothetical protein
VVDVTDIENILIVVEVPQKHRMNNDYSNISTTIYKIEVKTLHKDPSI